MDLTGRKIVVTGASKGIGAATLRALLAAGADVVAHYGGDLAGAEEAASGAPERVRFLQADLADMDAVDALWAAACEGGLPDVLVNNAGVMHQGGGIGAPIEEWDKVWAHTMAVNVHAPARLLRHAVNGWLEAGRGGSVIGIGSWVSTRGTTSPDAIAYAASKAAISAATKTVARAYAAKGIYAYVIAPGVVQTRMSEEAAMRTGGAAAVTAGLPMGEWVPPEEIADLAVYLARGRARHLTGATIDMNGAAYIR